MASSLSLDSLPSLKQRQENTLSDNGWRENLKDQS
jgi:hypothetical protein